MFIDFSFSVTFGRRRDTEVAERESQLDAMVIHADDVRPPELHLGFRPNPMEES